MFFTSFCTKVNKVEGSTTEVEGKTMFEVMVAFSFKVILLKKVRVV